MNKNLINTECEMHKKMCEYMCCYSKCAKHLICEKCRRQHIDIHPAQFIYELSNLAEIHSYNKIDKLKEVLIKEKLAQESTIRSIYQQFDTLVQPLTDRVKAFSNESRALIENELTNYLRSNKYIIDETEKEIKKTDTRLIKDDPNRMLEQTINEAQIINRREGRIIENGQGYKWYSDTTKDMCSGIITEVKSMISVAIKIIDNSMALQRNKYVNDNLQLDTHHQMSFYKKYHASNQIALERRKLQGDVLQSKSMLTIKEGEIHKTKKQVREKVIKISELEEKVQGLNAELLKWQQKLDREEKERIIAQERQRQAKKQILIRNGIIGSNGRSISFEKKEIDQNLLPLILQIVPNPTSLDLSNHNLTTTQIQMFLKCQSIQILKYNFTQLDVTLLLKLLQSYKNLQHLQLNSTGMDDNQLLRLALQFPQKMKVLYLIDNQITDDGLDQMLQRTLNLQDLYVSYNKSITSKSIESLQKYAPAIRVLHISKTMLRQKGGVLIGKHLHSLEELFIGSTGINKEGFLGICRGCTKLKRLSLVATEITTDVVTEILLGLTNLEWLDLSYCNFGKPDIEKIQKLKIFNKSLEIIFNN